MPGPAPTPSAIKRRNGNPGRRPLNAFEPQPVIAVPECPDFLGAEAREEWFRIVPELLTLGLLSNIDRTALAAYAVCYGRWLEAENELRAHGLTTVTNGYEQKSPWLTISDKCLEQLHRWIVQFGLTPASRSKVSGTPVANDDDDFFAVR